GAKPEAPLDVTQQRGVEQQSQKIREQRDRVAKAGGELLGAAFQFLGQLVGDESMPAPPDPPAPLVSALHQRLSECVDEDDAGRQRLSITLPDRETLGQFAETLARLLVAGEGNANSTAIEELTETPARRRLN
ncbi:MAG: hypothetical protein IID45_02330, partial [Planctomycetes bacterium]|nr:hypothetical protein [Planctomycetota bacterium]